MLEAMIFNVWGVSRDLYASSFFLCVAKKSLAHHQAQKQMLNKEIMNLDNTRAWNGD